MERAEFSVLVLGCEGVSFGKVEEGGDEYKASFGPRSGDNFSMRVADGLVHVSYTEIETTGRTSTEDSVIPLSEWEPKSTRVQSNGGAFIPFLGNGAVAFARRTK